MTYWKASLQTSNAPIAAARREKRNSHASSPTRFHSNKLKSRCNAPGRWVRLRERIVPTRLRSFCSRFRGFRKSTLRFAPVKLSDQFGQLQAVETAKYRDSDDADLQNGLTCNNARLNQLDTMSRQ